MERLRQVLVKDKMIPIGNVKALYLNKEEVEQEEKIAFVRVLDIVNDPEKPRAPVLDSSGKLLYIIHRSLVDRFIVREVIGSGAFDQKTYTLKSFLDADNDMGDTKKYKK